MGMNMGIYDWIQRNKDQQAPQEVQQSIANSDAPEKLTNAQKLAQDGTLTVGQAVQTAEDAAKVNAEIVKMIESYSHNKL
jgi:hypothetical protein